MQAVIKKEILYDLEKAVASLEQRNFVQLEKLSEHTIEDVAVQKDLELVTVTVLLYSLFKVAKSLSDEEIAAIVKSLTFTGKHLQQGNLGGYNRGIKKLYRLVKQDSAEVKMHLQNVMNAARIKKGTSLLQRGLSIGQAAGLMGLSNWDLQIYAGKTTALDPHDEKLPATKRVKTAMKLFGVRA
jgi:hypothetical protein